jgi:hypothetical protein
MPSLDQIEAYYIDVLGNSQDDCSQYTSDELWDYLTPPQQAECIAFNA